MWGHPKFVRTTQYHNWAIQDFLSATALHHNSYIGITFDILTHCGLAKSYHNICQSLAYIDLDL